MESSEREAMWTRVEGRERTELLKVAFFDCLRSSNVLQGGVSALVQDGKKKGTYEVVT
jgi:hypothetical protein